MPSMSIPAGRFRLVLPAPAAHIGQEVFWFGVDAQNLPAHPRGLALPSATEQLEAMLLADLAPDVRERIRVVFDVSER